MRVMGWDPGSSNIGWSVTEHVNDRTTKLLYYGLLSPASDQETANNKALEKMKWLYPQVTEIIRRHGVTHIRSEMVPSAQMGHRDQILACQNLLRTVAIEHGLNYCERTPRSIKLEATASGNASKDDMKVWVENKYPNQVVPEKGKRIVQYDVYDAIVIGSLPVTGKEKWFDFSEGQE